MDTSQYLSMFLEESSDNLQTLNECLLALENEPRDMEKLNEIFRVAHTIKGMAATMGYSKMAELTHKMEDVLSNFRQGKVEVTHKVVTVLFKCLDTLEAMVDSITQGEDGDIAIEEIVSHLEGVANGTEDGIEISVVKENVIEDVIVDDTSGLYGIELNEYELNIIKQAKHSNTNAYHIHITLDKGTILKSARTFVLFQTLEKNGEIIKSLPTLEDLETENFDLDIDLIYLSSKTLLEIEKDIKGISEIDKVQIFSLNNDSKIQENSEEVQIELNEYELNILKQAKHSDVSAYHIHITLDEGTILKSARTFVLFQALEQNGEIIKSIPALEDLEAENFDLDIDLIYLSSKTLKEIEKGIRGISEISIVQVFSLNDSFMTIGSKAEGISASECAASVDELSSKEIIKEKGSQPKAEKKDLVKEKNKNKPVEQASQNGQDKKVKAKGIGQSVRVDLDRLDKFMNMVSELVIHRTRLEQISSNHKIAELNETLEQVARTTTDLQDLVMKIRMLPLDVVFNRFPRMIRDLSLELGKEIELVIQGQDTELDRTVIEEIGEPLIHLLRNAADHGIETVEERKAKGKESVGKIKLIAYSEGTKAVIKVEDDGKGLDISKIKAKAEKNGISTEGMSEADIKNLIFAQGFSTNEVVTDISGRGVGMDVVKTKISSLGGTVDAISEMGKGTSFIIRLPLTLQIIQALLVKVGTETMAISLGFIDRVIEYKEENIRKSNNKEVVLYNGNVISVIRVNNKLNIDSVNQGKKYIILVKVGEREMGLVVDSLLGQQEIVIKPFGKTLKSTKEYIGATILGDGLVTLILDVAALI